MPQELPFLAHEAAASPVVEFALFRYEMGPALIGLETDAPLSSSRGVNDIGHSTQARE
ncbi:hypothetical protein ACIRPU_30095 [Streptomyces sp. NPDC102259]|uniref:hypothetical protein n=1 Tax=Streptomyces sp. NPDC102259 TaxID=3366148 RepID=UPI003829924B